jgi:hypothetical protein
MGFCFFTCHFPSSFFFIISCTVKLFFFGNNVAHVAIKNRPEFVICMFALVMSEFSASNSKKNIYCIRDSGIWVGKG